MFFWGVGNQGHSEATLGCVLRNYFWQLWGLYEILGIKHGLAKFKAKTLPTAYLFGPNIDIVWCTKLDKRNYLQNVSLSAITKDMHYYYHLFNIYLLIYRRDRCPRKCSGFPKTLCWLVVQYLGQRIQYTPPFQ